MDAHIGHRKSSGRHAGAATEGAQAGAPELTALDDLAPIEGSPGWFRAHGDTDDARIAVRLMDRDLDDRVDQRARALEVLSTHPHIVTVLGHAATSDGHVLLVIDLEEDALGEWIAADGRLPFPDVLDTALKLAGALETIHRAGLVHGAVGPDRILVASGGEPWLAGLEDAALGEPRPRARPRDDVRALGRTMFALLTATDPDDAPLRETLERCGVPDRVHALLGAILDESAAAPATAAALGALIRQAQIDLGIAPGTLLVDDEAAAVAREALAEVLERPVTVPAIPPAVVERPAEQPSEAAPTPGGSRPRARWALALLLALAVLAVVAARLPAVLRGSGRPGGPAVAAAPADAVTSELAVNAAGLEIAAEVLANGEVLVREQLASAWAGELIVETPRPISSVPGLEDAVTPEIVDPRFTLDGAPVAPPVDERGRWRLGASAAGSRHRLEVTYRVRGATVPTSPGPPGRATVVVTPLLLPHSGTQTIRLQVAPAFVRGVTCPLFPYVDAVCATQDLAGWTIEQPGYDAMGLRWITLQVDLPAAAGLG